MKKSRSGADCLFWQVRDAEGDCGRGQGSVQGHHPAAVVSTDRQMKRVAGAKAGLVVIEEARSCSEICARHQNYNETFLDQAGELRQAFGPMLRLNLPGTQF